MYSEADIEGIYIARSTDLRKSLDGLSMIVKASLDYNYLINNDNLLFIFCNRKYNKVKYLVWKNNEFELRYRKGKFKWLKNNSISRGQLRGFL